MVSITTDGAKNMIGQNRGLANEMVTMANERYGTTRRIGTDVHSVWCIDHRLNLVTKDFNEVPNINYVIAFIDWITANQRLVSYSAFARSHQTTKKKKSPRLPRRDGSSTGSLSRPSSTRRKPSRPL